jgi:hypothetical protein
MDLNKRNKVEGISRNPSLSASPCQTPLGEVDVPHLIIATLMIVIITASLSLALSQNKLNGPSGAK